MALHIIAPERIRALFNYEPETGALRWAVAHGKMRLGAIAGWRSCGYHMIQIDGHGYGAHVIIWVWMTGSWPCDKIDHADLDPLNNCWLNLREATQSQNKANGRSYKNNTSGFKNVFLEKNRKSPKKWRAVLDKDGKRRNIGYFLTKEEAASAIDIAARELFGEFARTA